MTTAYVTHPSYTGHDLPHHPEHAGRIQAVWQALESAGVTTRLNRVTPEKVTDEQILYVHTKDYLQLFREIKRYDHGVRFDADTYAFPESADVARLSAGGVVRAVDEVLRGSAQNALAAVRPPGHHAIPSRPMGFCLLGNISIAARYAQNNYDDIRRVMIVDFDVHHGNGTQDMFYGDDSVLFISTHQYPYYPGTGGMSETGLGRGEGYTINIPLSAGNGDDNYAVIYEQIVWKAARRFEPDLILVSAGFDAHWIDPLASMRLSLHGYAHLTNELIRMAKELCDNRIVFVMEGGYDLGALSHGMINIAHALLGDDTISDIYGKQNRPEPDVNGLLQELRDIHDL